MKIKNISCTQFAGINNRDVAFSDGLNVVYGKNESGKSTLVNLIARTLFQDAKLDKRSDRDFMNLYFPGQTKGDKVAGDFVDGTIVLEGEDGTYDDIKEAKEAGITTVKELIAQDAKNKLSKVKTVADLIEVADAFEKNRDYNDLGSIAEKCRALVAKIREK